MKTAIIISGPTGSGKTALAIKVAEALTAEIISADSRQIYKGLEIGTAQPTPDELRHIRHHLIGFLTVSEDYNAGRFEKDALQVTEDLFTRNNYVIVCGGTGLYIKTFIEGMDDVPPADAHIRQQLEHIYSTEGIPALQVELQERDPEYAAIVDLMNPQRLIRALEVCRITGLPYSSYRNNKKSKRTFRILHYSLNPEREQLYRQINQRTEIMFERGLLAEAEQMIPFRNYNALNTVGYKEIFDYFDNKISLEEAKEKIKQHTRNYAKRQLTWMRGQENIKFVDPADAAAIILKGLKHD